jgi:hypothetical protein
MNIRNPMGLLVLWLAELLDRSLIEVPDVDMQTPSPARSATAPTGDLRFPTIQGAGQTQSAR